jgi:hypothetical protein
MDCILCKRTRSLKTLLLILFFVLVSYSLYIFETSFGGSWHQLEYFIYELFYGIAI